MHPLPQMIKGFLGNNMFILKYLFIWIFNPFLILYKKGLVDY